MQYEIRTMSLAEVLDTSFRILRDHFVPIVGISAILNVPVALGQSLIQVEAEAGAAASVPLLTLAFGLLSFGLVSPIVGAAITHVIGEVYLGREAKVGESFRMALRILIPLVGTTLLMSVLMVGALLLLILPGIWFMLGVMVVTQVMVLERSFGMTAIRRSLELMKGNRGRVFLIVFVVTLVSLVLNFAFGLAAASLPWLGGLATGISGAVTGAFTSVALVVLYFEIRCRKEAFEIEHLARLVQASSGASPAASS